MALPPRRRHPETDYGNLGSEYTIIGGLGENNAPCDYIIYKAGTTTKAFNATTNVADFSGADAATVINAAIAACGYAARIYVKTGVYTLTTAILSGARSLTLEGPGIGTGAIITPDTAVTFRPDVGFTTDFLFKFGVVGALTFQSQLKNLFIDGRTYATCPGAIEWRNIHCGILENLHIVRFHDTATPGTGITFAGNAGFGGYWNQIRNPLMQDVVRGIYVPATYGNATRLIGGYLRNSTHSPAYGLVLDGCDTFYCEATDFSFFSQANSEAVRILSPAATNIFSGTRFEGNTMDVTIANGCNVNYFLSCAMSGTGKVTDNAAYPSQFTACKYHVTSMRGSDAINDGGTIGHHCNVTPEGAVVIGTVANEIVAVTAIDATNLTVAIKKRSDGSAGTNQVIYWHAWGTGGRKG